MDAVPGEPEIADRRRPMPGVVVLRSLTKTWGLAGLRAGYVVGDPAVIAGMRAQQPPWSVSTPALAAIGACLAARGPRLAAAAAAEIGRQRVDVCGPVWPRRPAAVGTPRAPFVLVDTGRSRPSQAPAAGSGWRCATQGFAVRRGETFPGLGPDWIRIAVRDEETTDRLAEALGA